LLTLGAVSVSAGMVHDPLSAAVVTTLHMASHMSSAAVEDVEHDPVLLRAHGVCLLVVCKMFSKNIC